MDELTELLNKYDVGAPKLKGPMTMGQKPEEEDELWKFIEDKSTTYDPFGAAGEMFRGLKRLPEQILTKAVEAIQGTSGPSVADPGLLDRLVNWANERQKEDEQRVRDKYLGVKPLPGFEMEDIPSTISNLGYSGVSALMGLGAGLPAGYFAGPLAGYAAGGGATFLAAKRMAGNELMRQYLEVMNQEKISKTGEKLNLEEEDKFKSEFEDKANAHGLWEAIPESISNMAGFGILFTPLRGMFGKNIATKILAKITGLYAEELATETVTEMGQRRTVAGTVLAEKLKKPDWTSLEDWTDALASVAPQTIMLTSIMGLAGGTMAKTHEQLKQKINPLKRARIEEDAIGKAQREAEIEEVPPEEEERGVPPPTAPSAAPPAPAPAAPVPPGTPGVFGETVFTPPKPTPIPVTKPTSAEEDFNRAVQELRAPIPEDVEEAKAEFKRRAEAMNEALRKKAEEMKKPPEEEPGEAPAPAPEEPKGPVPPTAPAAAPTEAPAGFEGVWRAANVLAQYRTSDKSLKETGRTRLGSLFTMMPDAASQHLDPKFLRDTGVTLDRKVKVYGLGKYTDAGITKQHVLLNPDLPWESDPRAMAYALALKSAQATGKSEDAAEEIAGKVSGLGLKDFQKFVAGKGKVEAAAEKARAPAKPEAPAKPAAPKAGEAKPAAKGLVTPTVPAPTPTTPTGNPKDIATALKVAYAGFADGLHKFTMPSMENRAFYVKPEELNRQTVQAKLEAAEAAYRRGKRQGFETKEEKEEWEKARKETAERARKKVEKQRKKEERPKVEVVDKPGSVQTKAETAAVKTEEKPPGEGKMEKWTPTRESKPGECYRNSAFVGMDLQDRLGKQATVVHGKIHSLKAGKKIDHAWIEVGGTVYDPTTGVKGPKNRFYELVQPEIGYKLSAEKAGTAAIRIGHWGPYTSSELEKIGEKKPEAKAKAPTAPAPTPAPAKPQPQPKPRVEAAEVGPERQATREKNAKMWAAKHGAEYRGYSKGQFNFTYEGKSFVVEDRGKGTQFDKSIRNAVKKLRGEVKEGAATKTEEAKRVAEERTKAKAEETRIRQMGHEVGLVLRGTKGGEETGEPLRYRFSHKEGERVFSIPAEGLTKAKLEKAAGEMAVKFKKEAEAKGEAGPDKRLEEAIKRRNVEPDGMVWFQGDKVWPTDEVIAKNNARHKENVRYWNDKIQKLGDLKRKGLTDDVTAVRKVMGVDSRETSADEGIRTARRMLKDTHDHTTDFLIANKIYKERVEKGELKAEPKPKVEAKTSTGKPIVTPKQLLDARIIRIKQWAKDEGYLEFKGYNEKDNAFDLVYAVRKGWKIPISVPVEPMKIQALKDAKAVVRKDSKPRVVKNEEAGRYEIWMYTQKWGSTVDEAKAKVFAKNLKKGVEQARAKMQEAEEKKKKAKEAKKKGIGRSVNKPKADNVILFFKQIGGNRICVKWKGRWTYLTEDAREGAKWIKEAKDRGYKVQRVQGVPGPIQKLYEKYKRNIAALTEHLPRFSWGPADKLQTQQPKAKVEKPAIPAAPAPEAVSIPDSTSPSLDELMAEDQAMREAEGEAKTAEPAATYEIVQVDAKHVVYVKGSTTGNFTEEFDTRAEAKAYGQKQVERITKIANTPEVRRKPWFFPPGAVSMYDEGIVRAAIKDPETGKLTISRTKGAHKGFVQVPREKTGTHTGWSDPTGSVFVSVQDLSVLGNGSDIQQAFVVKALREGVISQEHYDKHYAKAYGPEEGPKRAISEPKPEEYKKEISRPGTPLESEQLSPRRAGEGGAGPRQFRGEATFPSEQAQRIRSAIANEVVPEVRDLLDNRVNQKGRPIEILLAESPEGRNRLSKVGFSASAMDEFIATSDGFAWDDIYITNRGLKRHDIWRLITHEAVHVHWPNISTSARTKIHDDFIAKDAESLVALAKNKAGAGIVGGTTHNAVVEAVGRIERLVDYNFNKSRALRSAFEMELMRSDTMFVGMALDHMTAHAGNYYSKIGQYAKAALFQHFLHKKGFTSPNIYEECVTYLAALHREVASYVLGMSQARVEREVPAELRSQVVENPAASIAQETMDRLDIPSVAKEYWRDIEDIKKFAYAEKGTIKVYHGAPTVFARRLVERAKQGRMQPTWRDAEGIGRWVAKEYGIPWTEFYSDRTGADNFIDGYSGQKVRETSTAQPEVASRWAKSFPYGEVITDLNDRARLWLEAKRRGLKDIYSLWDEAEKIAEKRKVQFRYGEVADILGLPDRLGYLREGGSLVELEVDVRALPKMARKEAQSLLRWMEKGEATAEQTEMVWNTTYRDIKIAPQNIKSARIVGTVPVTYQLKAVSKDLDNLALRKQVQKDLALKEPAPGPETARQVMKSLSPQQRMNLKPLPMPELVELVQYLRENKDLNVEILPQSKLPKSKYDVPLGFFSPRTGKIRMAAEVYQDQKTASLVFSQQIGHLADWLPDKFKSRGNILGHIAKLKRFTNPAMIGIVGTNTEIRDELKAVSQIISPFTPKKNDKYTQARYSSWNLYADGFSMLMNDPALLQATAPKFTDAFFDYLHKNPKLEAGYQEIQNLLASPDVQEHRHQRLRKTFEDLDEVLRKKGERPKEKMWEGIQKEMVDTNIWAYKMERALKKAGIVLPPDSRITYWLEELPYIESVIYRYLRDVNNVVNDHLKKHGIDVHDFGAFVFHRRILFDKMGKAYPLGFEKKTSAEQLRYLRDLLGKDKYAAMLEAQDKLFFPLREKHVLDLIRRAKLFESGGALEQLLITNRTYAAWDVGKFLASRFGSTPSSYIYKWLGTHHKITNPWIATVLKDMSILRMASRKLAAQNIVAELDRLFGTDEVKKAEWKGKAVGFSKPKDRDFDERQWGLIQFMHEGKLQGFWVRKDLADTFNYNYHEMDKLVRAWQFITIPLKDLLVRKNPVWMTRNIIRDLLDTMKKIDSIGVVGGFRYMKILKEVMKKDAYLDVFKSISTPAVDEMYKNKMLVVGRYYQAMDDPNLNNQLERMIRFYSLTDSEHSKNVLKRLFDTADKMGQYTERINKIAAYKYLKQYTNKTDKEVAHDVRTLAGTPDPYRAGKLSYIYNNILMFSNIAKEGWRAHIEAMHLPHKLRDVPKYLASIPRSSYWMKTLAYSIFPKMVLVGAAIGMMGKKGEDWIRQISEYNKMNYLLMPPVPFAFTKSGKAIYLRIPQDYGGQFFGALAWKALNHGYKMLFDNEHVYDPDFKAMLAYTMEEQPWGNLHPYISAIWNATQYMSGQNPYDTYRGQFVVPDNVWKAKDYRATLAVGKYVWNQLGLRMFYTMENESVPKIKEEYDDWAKKIPVFGPTLWTWLQVSDYGLRQRANLIKDEVEAQHFRKLLDVRERILDDLQANKGQPPSASRAMRLYGRLVREKMVDPNTMTNFRHMYMRYASRTWDNNLLDAIIFAGTNEQRGRVLYDYKKTMEPEEYNRLVAQLRREGHLKYGAFKELREVEREKRRGNAVR